MNFLLSKLYFSANFLHEMALNLSATFKNLTFDRIYGSKNYLCLIFEHMLALYSNFSLETWKCATKWSQCFIKFWFLKSVSYEFLNEGSQRTSPSYFRFKWNCLGWLKMRGLSLGSSMLNRFKSRRYNSAKKTERLPKNKIRFFKVENKYVIFSYYVMTEQKPHSTL